MIVNESPRRFPALDGVRGIAILLVLLHHCYPTSQASTLSRAIAHVVDVGWIGVNLFFVLSGFLITGILLDTKGHAHYYRNFIIRRALRILPLYYGFLLVHQCFALTTARRMAHGFLSPRPLSWPITVFLTNMPEVFPVGPLIGELGPLWSLAVEEQAYLILPLLVALLSRGRLLQLLVAIIPLALVWRLVVLAGFMRPEVAYTWMPSCLDAFAAGGIAAIALRQTGNRSITRRFAATIAVLSGIVLVAMFIVQGHFHIWENMKAILGVGLSALSLFFAAMIGVSVLNEDDSPLNRFLRLRLLREAGRYSFAMYLFHTAAFDLLHPWLLARLGPKIVAWNTPTSCMVFLLVVATTFIAARVSARVLERPFLRLKQYFPSVRAVPKPIFIGLQTPNLCDTRAAQRRWRGRG